MDAALFVKLVVAASVLALVFALGLGASFEDATYLFRHPAKFLRALIAMYLVVPVAATVLAMGFQFKPAIEVALIAVAISPVPPVLPRRQLSLGARSNHVYGLLISMSVAAIVMVPLAVSLLAAVFGRPARVDVVDVMILLARTVFVPLVAGLLVRRHAPEAARRLGPLAMRTGNILMLAGVLPVLVKVAPTAWELVGEGSLVALAALAGIAVCAGHFLGGPDPAERTSLAMASALRHPGVALLVARFSFGGDPSIPAAVLLYVIVAAVVSSAYGAWRPTS